MLAVAVCLFAVATTHGLSDDATEELARMSRQIVSKHFLNSKCLALVSDDNGDIMDYIHPLDIPVLHVHLPFAVMKKSKIPSSGLFKRCRCC
jgi:hypothetical protein